MKPRIMRWLKIIFFIVLFTPLVLFLAFWGAVYFIDFNQYKPQLEAEVYDKTGHKFELLGELDFKVVPLRLEIGKSKLYQKAEFNSEQTLLEFEQLNLSLSLAKLILKKQFHLLGVEILDPKLNLVVNEKGLNNWNNLAANTNEYQFIQVKQEIAATPLPGNLIQSLELKSLNIENGEVTYENQLNQELYQLRNWSLMAFNLAFEQDFRLKSTAKLEDIKRQETTDLNLKAEGIIGQNFDKLELRKVIGSLDKTLSNDEDQEGKLSFNLKQANWDKSSNNLVLDKLNIQVKGDDFTLNLTSNLDELAGQGQLEITRINPTKWLEYFLIDEPQWLVGRSMKRLRGTTDFSFNLQQGYNLENIQLRLDSTNIEGNLAYQQEPPKYTFDLTLDEINLDNYRIVKTSEDGTSKQYIPLAIPVSTLRNTSIEGKLSVKKLTAWQGNYTNLFTRVNSNFGQLRLAPFDFDLYGGKWQSSLLIDANGQTPTYAAKGKLTQVESQAWLQDLFDYSDLEGKLNLQFNFLTHGTNLELIKTHLKGDYSLEVLEGAYLALDLDKLVVGQLSKEADKTSFKLVQINGQANNGKLHIQRGLLQSSRLQAQTFGAVNLLDNTLDNQISLSYTNPPSALAFLAKVNIPIRLTGKLDEPKWELDVNQLLLGN